MFRTKSPVFPFALVLLTGCVDQPGPISEKPGASTDQDQVQGSLIDQRSYRLGSIGAFAEMVGAHVKELALSAPMTPQEMDALVEAARTIVAENGAELFLETEFLVTDLFSPELTDGKQVLVIYRGETLDRYQALKAEKLRLEEEGRYHGEPRLEIARRFGRLLSYSEEKIEALLEGPDSTR